MSILFLIIAGILFLIAIWGFFEELDNGDVALMFIASGIFAIAGVLA